MLKLGRVTKFKMLFVVLAFVFNFDLVKFSAAIFEKGLLIMSWEYWERGILPWVFLLMGVYFCRSERLSATL